MCSISIVAGSYLSNTDPNLASINLNTYVAMWWNSQATYESSATYMNIIILYGCYREYSVTSHIRSYSNYILPISEKYVPVAPTIKCVPFNQVSIVSIYVAVNVTVYDSDYIQIAMYYITYS